MQQQTFPIVGRKPDVVISRVEGNLDVRAWEREEIQVTAQGEVGTLRQEGNTLHIAGSQGDLELFVPAIWKIVFPVSTSITASHVSQNVTVEQARKVALHTVGSRASLRNIAGNVELEQIGEVADMDNIGGNLRAAHVPTLRARHVGGNVTLLDTAHADVHAVGGNLGITRAAEVDCSTVGGNLDVDSVEGKLRVHAVGGNCEVRRSSAEVRIDTVGGNFVSDEGVRTGSCSVGGNLRAYVAEVGDARFHVGGQARVVLPERANATVRVMACGNISGPQGNFSRGPGMMTLVYGEGQGHITVTSGGNVSILGGGEPQVSGGFSADDMGKQMAEIGREWGRVGAEVGREMSRIGRDFGREMGRIGRDIQHEMRREWQRFDEWD
ncbi:MAG: hypothetical protein J2P36_32215 [Ktedonobacteraceae bacterium]|nr:hypothetical protein [Ktedonobacteraceae bacterium]